MFVIILLIIGALLLIGMFASGARARSQGRELHLMTISLGDVTRHDYGTIVRTLGNPNAISSIADGGRMVQWIRPGYRVAMSFDKDDRCLGIDHEVAV